MMNSVQKWLIVLGGFVSYFLADGYTYSLGVFYSYFLNAFGSSSSSTAVLPGMLYAIPQLSAFVICPFLETFGYSTGAAWGAVLLSSSCVASAFAPNLHVLYFTLGVVTSIGLQLTYSSAIIAVTAAFQDTKFFGLALGLMMCGSGIGSFLSNPFLVWLLNSWTWREVMIIQSAILLNSLVSAACFHHADASQIHRESSCMKHAQDSNTVMVHLHGPLCEHSSTECSPTFSHRLQTDRKRNSERLASEHSFVWSVVRYVLCVPVKFRFRVNPTIPRAANSPNRCSAHVYSSPSSPDPQPTNEHTSQSCAEFCLALRTSLHFLSSPGLWKNQTFLTFIVANGLTGAAIVLPWTFIYDHVLVSISSPEGLDTVSASQIAWLPSLIGFGSLCGQLIFGLLTSQLGDFQHCCRSGPRTASVSSGGLRFRLANSLCTLIQDKRRFHLSLFALAAVWNAACMLLIALLPIREFRSLLGVSFFSWLPGQVLFASCLFLGVSIGAVYVLYPQILLDAVGEQLWAASLGILLAVNGLMNLIGTMVGGRIYDSTGTYYGAFLLASCLPMCSAVLISVQQCLEHGPWRKIDVNSDQI